MRYLFRNLAVVLLTLALGGPAFIAGCAEHTRYYDPYYSDYHTWNGGEVVSYNRWEHETHRDHVDFAKRNDADKKEYYTWRHNQGGH
jgi:hypothetical protein